MNITRQVQLHQLEMLKCLASIFDAEGITYFAIGGTALGAVRHEGFIPWDDDIDLAMPRDDYERFLKLQDRLPVNLIIQNFRTQNEYPLYFSKVRDIHTRYVEKRLGKYDIAHGVFIDIFPWDAVGDATAMRRIVKRNEHRFKRSIVPSNKGIPAKIKAYFYRALYGFKSPATLFERLDESCRCCNGQETGRIGNLCYDDIIATGDLLPLERWKFEDTMIWLPGKVRKYLSDKYGDYMRIPDEKDRITHNPIEVAIPADTPSNAHLRRQA
ncbi:MAG TPA: LicD family protein [Gammaproteobacteria bacterium]|nr:LicD family protein [Gammaproteobacteria bacterium]